MLDPAILVIVFLTFLLAGGVKGIVGLGLPTVSISLLTATLGLKTAIALALVPAFATNVWQALQGGRLKEIVARLWPLLVTGALFTWLAAGVLANADVRPLTILLGVLLALYAASALFMPPLPAPGRHELWLKPLAGAFGGTLTGLTGIAVIPTFALYQAMGFPRDFFIQALGVWFLSSFGILGLALGRHEALSGELLLASSMALVPALAGQWIGQRLRRHIPEAAFRRLILAALGIFGLFLAIRAL